MSSLKIITATYNMHKLLLPQETPKNFINLLLAMMTNHITHI